MTRSFVRRCRGAALLLAMSWAAGAEVAPGPAPEPLFSDGFERDLIAWSAVVTPCDSDVQCNGLLRFWSRCSAAACVECLDSNDCLNNPTALGTTCVSGTCQCSDCAANPAGPVCAVAPVACTCAMDPDCAPPATCRATPYLGGATTCWAGGT